MGGVVVSNAWWARVLGVADLAVCQVLRWWWGGWCVSLRSAWFACPCPFQLVCDVDPARVGEVATLLRLCLRRGRCGSYLLPVLCGSACPGGIPVLGGCLVQLLGGWGARKPEPASGVACPAKVPGASRMKCLCAVLPCRATWEAIPNSKEVPCNHVSSSELTFLDSQVGVTCCSQSLPTK